MKFWILVVLLGVEGAAADIVCGHWGKVRTLGWWCSSAGLWLVYMTGFGLAISFGKGRGYSTTISVIIVLVASTICVGAWDIIHEQTKFTPIQWLGIVLAMSAMLLFELGKK